MDQEKKKELEQQLDEAARLWKEALSEGNEAEARTHRNNIFLLVFKLYDRGDRDDLENDPNAVINALEEVLNKYSPKAGKFSHYFNVCFNGRKKDIYKYNKRHSPCGDSLDRPVSEDEKLTLGDSLPADALTQPESTMRIDSRLAGLTAEIMSFLAKRGKTHSDARKMWFRLFYTEDMTLAMRLLPGRLAHERDVFASMDTAYLDYYMDGVCHTKEEVSDTPLKPYRQVVPTQKKEGRIPLPIPGDVSLAYLKNCRGICVGPTARSNQIGVYEKLKKALAPK